MFIDPGPFQSLAEPMPRRTEAVLAATKACYSMLVFSFNLLLVYILRHLGLLSECLQISTATFKNQLHFTKIDV